jgi:hypothetical protein
MHEVIIPRFYNSLREQSSDATTYRSIKDMVLPQFFAKEGLYPRQLNQS